VVKKLGASKSGATAITGSIVGYPYAQALHLVSDGLASAINFSSGGTITGVLPCKENASSTNANQVYHIWVTQGDSSTPRGTLVTLTKDPDEMDSAACNGESFSLTIENNVSAQIGDRIVVESGKWTAAATGPSTHGYGGTGADLTDGTAYTDGVGWVSFPYTTPTVAAKNLMLMGVG
jgi:hypothetical protein